MRRATPLLARAMVAGALAGVAMASTATVAATASNDPARPSQWNLDRIRAEQAWPVATGTGVIVAVVDSGVDLRHEDLAGQLVPGHDFVDDDDDPQDAYGHGTHVAGIVAAVAGNGRGVAGVAPGAKVMPVRVLDDDGSGTLEHVQAGVRWAVAHGAKVVNLSLGDDTQALGLSGPGFADLLRETWQAGVVPVVAAGNQFVTGSGFTDEPALVVAATNRDDGKPTYSSGVGQAKWGMAAPGGELPDLGPADAILSTYWTGTRPNQYAYLAGTSQAAPHVSGALAILLATHRFTPAQAVQRLLDTAVDIGAKGRDSTFGAGRLDLAAAVAGLAPRSTPSTPTSVRASSGAGRSAVTTQATVPSASLAPPSPSVPGLPTTATTGAPDAGEAASLGRGGRGGGSVGSDSDRTIPALVAAALAAGVAAATWRRRPLG